MQKLECFEFGFNLIAALEVQALRCLGYVRDNLSTTFSKYLVIDYFGMFYVCSNYASFSFYFNKNKNMCTVTVVIKYVSV